MVSRPSCEECKMNTSRSTDSRKFFYSERNTWIMLIVWLLFSLTWIAALALGVISNYSRILFLLSLALWTAPFVWLIWLGRRYPIFTLSEGLVEWREPFCRKPSSVSTTDIINAEQVTTHVVVLKTNSKGSIRIPLIGLSPEDRQEIKELIESQFGER